MTCYTICVLTPPPTVIVGFQFESLTVREDAANVFVNVTLAEEISAPVTVDILFFDGAAMVGSGR